MNTNDLIQRLGNDLAPVQPLAAPWKRAGVWLACASAYLGAVVLVAWMRGRLVGSFADSAFVAQQLAVLALAVTAAIGAYVSIVPGANRRVLGAPMVPGALLATTLVWGCVTDAYARGTLGLGRETDWPCVVSLTLGGVALWALAMMMLRRGAPLAPRITSLLAGIAALSVANIEACVSRPHAFSITVLVWHGLTMALLIAVMMRAGSGLLPWKRLEPR